MKYLENIPEWNYRKRETIIKDICAINARNILNLISVGNAERYILGL